MTHVELHARGGHPASLKVDGIDLSAHVSRDVRVEIDPDYELPVRVHVIILAHTFDGDLPDALLSATEGAGA
jgi:hypothetical protein